MLADGPRAIAVILPPTRGQQLRCHDRQVVFSKAILMCGIRQCVMEGRYPQISRSWQAHWINLATFFAYPADIRKVIYTTNAIESLNSVILHAIKKRKVLPTDEAVKKEVWLAIQAASQKWTMPLRDWRMAMSRFIIAPGWPLLRKDIYTESCTGSGHHQARRASPVTRA